ncbi:putative zinc-binding alcohol dehydrogenase [Lasiodiplodia hormozganensis]|uniref:Zinc-binding alcohol dehydrogenase n=1 Tax=Lasiodiplodia hormozganensis TaxID=869390 RepID=A0AA40CHU9_9PEZI|nr:putative zinc-binding alcohol dehydrogenase [Lasiodiplodia hormozganensis]
MASGATMMRGVIYEAPYQVTVTDLPIPTLEARTDAIIRMTHAAICGSDLHTYHGLQGVTAPWGLGHEGIGYIAELGDAVSSLSVGDYVVIPDNLSNGHLNMEEPAPSEMVGFGGVGGGLGGLQAEYARVPHADQNLIPVPLTRNATNATLEQSYVTTSDIFATAWTGLDFAGFQPGDTIAIFGAGPVGLLAAYSAILRGASHVYSIDHVPARLERAASIGAIPINFNESDPVAQILEYEPAGVRRALDCVGYSAINAAGENEPDIVIRQMIAVTGSRGGIGQVGVFMVQNETEAAPFAGTISPQISFPVSDFWTKALSFQSGAVRPLEVAPELVELISSGRADPSFITTAVIGIEQVPEYYQRFDQHEEIKVYIQFP